MHPMSGIMPLPCVPPRVTRGALIANSTRLRIIGAVELLNTAGPSCHSLYLYGKL